MRIPFNKQKFKMSLPPIPDEFERQHGLGSPVGALHHNHCVLLHDDQNSQEAYTGGYSIDYIHV